MGGRGLIVAVVMLGTVACGGDDSTGADAAALGAELYAARCAICHGDDGEGGTGPALGGGATDDASVDELLEVVRDGRNAMPSFATRLGEAEIVAVVDYVRGGLGPGAG